MPGPLSAPNGERALSLLPGKERVRRAEAHQLDTGKTRLKKEKQ